MDYTRREFARLALATVPAMGFLDRSVLGAALQGKPNSVINGVQIGTITYSYRSMADQSAEATLKYIVNSGISGTELMGGPIEAYARARTNFEPSTGRRGGGGGGGRAGGNRGRGRGGPDPATLTAKWNGVPCAPGEPGEDPNYGPAPADAGRRGGGGGGGRGGQQQTPEQIAAAAEERKWRMGLSMDIFRDLRKMYNDAGVTIYAVKLDNRMGSDEDLEYTFSIAEALGATHVTLELPTGPTGEERLKHLGDWGVKKKIYVAYHSHLQGSMTAFDRAFAVSPGNMANVDLGHFVAGGNRGGTPIDFLNKYHARIASFHLKDRTLPQNCGLNLPFGQGQTPIRDILQLLKKNQWKFPASIELEYTIPQGSDAVQEVRKCLEYCRQALA